MEAEATCCCHWHRLYYIGMAANRCRYKRRAAVNKYDNGGWSERKRGTCGVRYGIPVYKSDHQKQRPVTVRTSHMSYGVRTYTHTHTKAHAAHDDNIERETMCDHFPIFLLWYDAIIRDLASHNFWFRCETSFLFFKLTYLSLFQVTKFIEEQCIIFNRFM